MCPPPRQIENDGQNGQEGGENFGDAGQAGVGTDKCSFPLQRGSEGYCASRVNQALKTYITNEDGDYDEWTKFTHTTEDGLNAFLKAEVGSEDKPLSKIKQFSLSGMYNGGCQSLFSDAKCKLFDDQYKQLLEKRGMNAEWSNEYKQWR